MRLYPALATLTRVCTKKYTFPGTNVTIDKGVKVLIPVFSFHRDPDFYPDPLEWNPDRFFEDDIGSKPMYPFGMGPRACIGKIFCYDNICIWVTSL